MKAPLLLSVLSALTLTAHSSSAQPIINYDFEDSSTAGWHVHSATPENPYLLVVDDPVRGSTNKVLRVDGTYGGLDAVRTALPENLSTGTYELKFQIMVSGKDGGASVPKYHFDRRISFLDSTAQSGQTGTYIRYHRVTSYNQFNAYNGNGAGGGGWEGPETMVYDQWYEITQTINLDEKSWSWSFENLTTGAQSHQSETLGFFRDIPNIAHLIFLDIDGSKSGLFYLDQVRMTAIPETNSTALMVTGAMVGVVGLAVRSARRSSVAK